MQVGISCFVVFLVMAALMYSRRMPALLALPIMAFAIALISGIPTNEIFKDVINGGIMKLHVAYATTMIGAILAELVNKQGIAKSMVRFVAEYAGDNPFILGGVLTLVTALLFSCLGGLGAVIMVGTVILPVMMSIGIAAEVAGGLFLMGISLGGMFNLSNWQLYIEVLKLEQQQIVNYIVPFSIFLFLIILTYLLIELKSRAALKYFLLILALVAVGIGLNLSGNPLFAFGQSMGSSVQTADANSYLAAGACLILLCLYAAYRHFGKIQTMPALSFLTPLIPLVLVLACHWDIISSFIAGIIFGVLVYWQPNSINTLTRSIIEGAANVIPAVILMMGIGMLLAAVMHPAVATSMAPLLQQIVPTHAMAYIVVFTIAAPLALYRGPLSLWGMGSGIVALMQKSTTLAPQAMMSMLMSVGQLQGICDPTNTHNVWIATYLGLDAQTLLKKTIPYAWLAVIVGLLIAVFLKYVPW